jgi:antitoxin PrlF
MYQEPGAPPPAPGFFVLKDAEASPAASKLNGQTRFARLVNSSAGQYLAEKGCYADRTMATTVTAKGQVTIPKQVRDLLGLVPGSKIDFHRAADGSIVLERVGKGRPASRFEKLRGHAGEGLDTGAIMALTRGEK